MLSLIYRPVVQRVLRVNEMKITDVRAVRINFPASFAEDRAPKQVLGRDRRGRQPYVLVSEGQAAPRSLDAKTLGAGLVQSNP